MRTKHGMYRHQQRSHMLLPSGIQRPTTHGLYPRVRKRRGMRSLAILSKLQMRPRLSGRKLRGWCHLRRSEPPSSLQMSGGEPHSAINRKEMLITPANPTELSGRPIRVLPRGVRDERRLHLIQAGLSAKQVHRSVQRSLRHQR